MGTHHAAPAVPAGEAVTVLQQLDEVELVVVVPDVGLVQGAVIVPVHLGRRAHGQARLAWAALWGRETQPHPDRARTALGHQRRPWGMTSEGMWLNSGCGGRFCKAMAVPWVRELRDACFCPRVS